MDTDRDPLDEAARISADWLNLREAADSAARSTTGDDVAQLLSRSRPATVVDVGCGTGSGGRWLQPLLAGDESWVLIDHDPDLLAQTADRLRECGAAGTIHTRAADVSALDTVLTETGRGQVLVIASALLDLLTAAQIRQLLTTVERHGTELLVALTVTGGLHCEPPHPADELIAAAFNRHQRQGARCGPEAAQVFTEAADDLGLTLRRWQTPWELGAASAALIDQLIRDRAAVAQEQLEEEGTTGAGADHIEEVHRWRRERLEQNSAGELEVTVDHVDMLVGRAGLEPATKRL